MHNALNIIIYNDDDDNDNNDIDDDDDDDDDDDNSIQRRTFARPFEDYKFILLFPHCRDKILLSTHNDSRSLSSAKASEGINDRLLLIMDLQNYSGIS